jgi:predicted small secreted protein
MNTVSRFVSLNGIRPIIFGAVACALLLGCAACNTTAGVGKDIKAAGRGLENTAERAKN